MKKPDFLEKNIVWILFIIPFVIGVIKLLATEQSDWMTTWVYLIYIAWVIPASIWIWIISYGAFYGIDYFANNIASESERIKRKRLGIYLALIISILFSLSSWSNNDTSWDEVTSIKVLEKVSKIPSSTIKNGDNQIIEKKKLDAKRFFADPNSTIEITWLMMKEAKWIEKLQDLILTKECLSFSKLYTTQAKKLNMWDWTTLTRIEPINLYDTKSYEKNGPLYDEVSTESAWNCVRSLIKWGLIKPEVIGDKKLIETLKYMEL